LPDRSSLSGPCTVIYAGADDMDVRRVGRLVAEAVRRPLPDVTRELRTSKGFLAKELDAAVAVALAEKAEGELRAPVLVVPDDACVPFPDAMRMRRATADAAGLRCEAYTWDRTEQISAGWNDIFLISCGRFEVQRAVEAQEDRDSDAGFMTGRMPPTVMQTRHEFLFDLVLSDPWRRLRLDQNTTAFSLTEMRRDPEDALGQIYRSALNLQRFAQGVPMNRGVELLAAGASESAWQELTFLSRRDFEAYTRWLLQLVRFGRPIPT